MALEALGMVETRGLVAAIEAADVVLMDDDPLKIAKAIRISRKCMRIVHENIWFAIGIKVRRAVGIRIQRGKCVRHKLIDTAHHQVVHQPFHGGHILGPAIGAEHLAHCALLHMRPDVRQRTGQLAKHMI